MGEVTYPNKPFKHDASYNPKDPYSISKFEAEQGLKKIAASHNMQIVVIRPPLIMVRVLKGNFALLMKLCRLQMPSFWLNKEQTSLIGAENLVDFIVLCLKHPMAGNGTFLVGDDDDMHIPIVN